MHANDFNAETSEEEIPKYWDKYYADEACRKVPGYLGIYTQSKAGGNLFRYGIGCRASDVEGVPESFEIVRIPEYTWAVFRCIGPVPRATQTMWERIYREWLLVSGYELIPDYEIENYLPGDPSSPDYVSEICVPIRKSS